MVGGCFPCLSRSMTCSSLLLLVIRLCDVEALSCQLVIHRKVGDTVELSACLETEGSKLKSAIWKYEEEKIAIKDVNISAKQFTHRLDLNPTNLSLTIKELELSDSGNFSFLSSDDKAKQRETVFVTLQVHEPIKRPVLTYNSTWHATSQSCKVFLECSATTGSWAKYNWTVGNQTTSGSRLIYSIRTLDRDTNFTCTVYNFVSEVSESKVLKCSNETQEAIAGHVKFFIILGSMGGAALLIIIVVAIVLILCHKQSQRGSDINDLTVYADISATAIQDEISSRITPCSVYETIENTITPAAPESKTVYDKIHFNRQRKESVSPYQ